jgi:hypothetical protein
LLILKLAKQQSVVGYECEMVPRTGTVIGQGDKNKRNVPKLGVPVIIKCLRTEKVFC